MKGLTASVPFEQLAEQMPRSEGCQLAGYNGKGTSDYAI